MFSWLLSPCSEHSLIGGGASENATFRETYHQPLQLPGRWLFGRLETKQKKGWGGILHAHLIGGCLFQKAWLGGNLRGLHVSPFKWMSTVYLQTDRRAYSISGMLSGRALKRHRLKTLTEFKSGVWQRSKMAWKLKEDINAIFKKGFNNYFHFKPMKIIYTDSFLVFCGIPSIHPRKHRGTHWTECQYRLNINHLKIYANVR